MGSEDIAEASALSLSQPLKPKVMGKAAHKGVSWALKGTWDPQGNHFHVKGFEKGSAVGRSRVLDMVWV